MTLKTVRITFDLVVAPDAKYEPVDYAREALGDGINGSVNFEIFDYADVPAKGWDKEAILCGAPTDKTIAEYLEMTP